MGNREDFWCGRDVKDDGEEDVVVVLVNVCRCWMKGEGLIKAEEVDISKIDRRLHRHKIDRRNRIARCVTVCVYVKFHSIAILLSLIDPSPAREAALGFEN